VETREIVLQCGNSAVRINPMTWVANSGPSKEPFRSGGSVDPHIIVIEAAVGKMRIVVEVSGAVDGLSDAAG
jgi:hypothetical protein